MDLGSAMERAEVLDWSLQEKLRPHMSNLRPRASIYIPEFIAANQAGRADNVLKGTMAEQVRPIPSSVCVCASYTLSPNPLPLTPYTLDPMCV